MSQFSRDRHGEVLRWVHADQPHPFRILNGFRAVERVHGIRDQGEGQPPASSLDVRSAEIEEAGGDRKSTRLNSSHLGISYAVFCLKKKKQKNTRTTKVA